MKLTVLVIFLCLGLIYGVIIRPWFQRWGATDAELSLSLPGDDLNLNPVYTSTRAITINAPAENIWPWLAQIGQERGGFYSYSWLENLVLADIHNADRIHPEWQSTGVGDFVRSASRKWYPDKAGWTVAGEEPGRFFILKNWGPFFLEPIDSKSTRLILRTYNGKMILPLQLFWFVFIDQGHFVMEKKMMFGIKRRAEGKPGPPEWLHILATAGFIAAGLGCALLILARTIKWLWLSLPLAYFLLILLSTSDLCSAIVGFVALILVLFGFLVFRRRWLLYFVLFWIYTFSVLLFSSDAYLLFGLLFWVAIIAAIALTLIRQKRPPASVSN